MEYQTKPIFLVLGILMALTLALIPNGISQSWVYAYTLTINPYGGTFEQDNDGTSIYVYNLNTDLYQHKEYVGLPPSSIQFNWYDYQFPEGSYFNVCAFDSVTGEILNCEKNHYRIYGHENEYLDLNLNP
jgi:hypothetical protein